MDIKIRPEDIRYAYEEMVRFQFETGAEWEEWLDRNCPAFWKALSGEIEEAAYRAHEDREARLLEVVNTGKPLALVFAAVFSARGKTFPELSYRDFSGNFEVQTVGNITKVSVRTNEVVQEMWKTDHHWTETFLDMQTTFKLSVRSLIVLYALIKALFDALAREETAEQNSEAKLQGV